jgi:hypothetical protein
MAATAKAHPPTAVLLAVSVAFFGLLFLLLRQRDGFSAPAFLRFALGNELSFVLLSILFDVQRGAFDLVVAHVVLELLFIIGLVKLRNEDATPTLPDEATTPNRNP